MKTKQFLRTLAVFLLIFGISNVALAQMQFAHSGVTESVSSTKTTITVNSKKYRISQSVRVFLDDLKTRVKLDQSQIAKGAFIVFNATESKTTPKITDLYIPSL